MLVANRLIRKAERGPEIPFDFLTLDSGRRHLRRARLASDGGRDVLIDLAQATFLRHGDTLAAEGGLIEIRAAPEPLMEIKAPDALNLTRIAWHLGNRHTAVEVTVDAIFIQPDNVLKAMVESLGAMVTSVFRVFEPEAGAYSHPH